MLRDAPAGAPAPFDDLAAHQLLCVALLANGGLVVELQRVAEAPCGQGFSDLRSCGCLAQLYTQRWSLQLRSSMRQP